VVWGWLCSRPAWPDRLYTKVSGDRSTEVWYDGVGITLVLHNDKIFGQGRAPETLGQDARRHLRTLRHQDADG
jgi:uncharacterized protein DUF2092